MKGTSHEILHSWLTPHMKEIEKLEKVNHRKDANKIVGELKKSIEKYHKYFNSFLLE
jgi:hypothetical protein